MGLLFLFGSLLAAGLFFVLLDLLRLPYLSTAKAMLNTTRAEKKAARSVEAYLMIWAVKLSKYIRMDEYRKHRLKNVLKATGMNMEPEVYQAYALVKTGAVSLVAIPAGLVFPLAVPVVVFLAVLVYFKETKKADEKLKVKRAAVESELPRFVANIEQELKASRDVLSIVENFKKNAGEAFGGELDILAADMRSSSYEAALTRFEARLNSPMLSDVTRGLIGVLRGDDSAVYFQMLAHDFKQLELQRLKSEAQKIPPKIRVFSFLMLMCFLFTYLAIIAFEIINSLGGMFYGGVNMKKILKCKRGEGYIDVCILVLCAILVIALAVKVLPVFIAKQQLDTYATELCREAEISGRVGSETSRRAALLTEQTGLSPHISWSKTGSIQLNEEITVTLTLEKNLGLFGGFGSFPITLRSQASGKSEVYHK